MALRRGRKWNGLNFKRLGKVRVIIFENIFAIVVPVDLSSYVFGRWWGMCIWPALLYGINRFLDQLKWGYGKRSMNVDARAIPVV
jgi:hypothetical protein